MTPLAFALCGTLLFGSPLHFAPRIDDLEEAIKAAQRSAPSIRGQIDRDLGREAVEALGEEPKAKIRALVRIAREGKQTAEATRALCERVVEEPELAPFLLQVLLKLPPEIVVKAARATSGWEGALDSLLREGASNGAVARAYAWTASTRAALDFLRRAVAEPGAGPKVSSFLAALARSSREPEALAAGLLTMGDVGTHEAALRKTLDVLVRRSPGAYSKAMFLAQETRGPTERAVWALRTARPKGKEARKLLGFLKLRSASSREGVALAAFAGLVDRGEAGKDVERAVRLASRSQGATRAGWLRVLPAVVVQYARSVGKNAAKSELEKIRKSAGEILAESLGSSETVVLVAALRQARRQRGLGLLREAVLKHCTAKDARVCIEALVGAALLKLDARIVDLLLTQMANENRAVAVAAHKSLVRLTKVSIPLDRPRLWKAWRARASLQ
jgi:hypothetical protein